MSEDWRQPTETRRTILKYMGAAAGLGVVGSQLEADPWAHPVAALQSDEDAFTTEELRIESFDGTELDATMYEPDAEGPHPVILMTHGWGGDKTQLQPLASVYASREYVVLAYTSRGFGQTEESEGSGGEVNSTSELEQQDAQYLIGWLADQDAVVTDGADNPRIGMDGVSYGGGIQLRTAAHDDRLDAIVPRATWNDLTQSLAYEGVIKRGWLTALEFGANQAPPTGNVAPEVEATSSGILERGFLTEEDIEFYQSRSPVSYPEIDTPALLIPEWTDQLFPINEGVANFRKIQESDTETTLLIGQDGTHILGHGEDFPPGSGTSRQFVGQQAVAWLDAHLKGDGDHGLSTFHYYDEDADEFRAAEEFPPYEEQSISHTFDRTVELRGGDANVITVDRQISEETEIIGIPTLDVEVTPTGEGPSHLFVALQRVRDGEVKTIKEQVTPVRLEAEGAQEVELDLFGVQDTLSEGDVLRIAMSAREEPLSVTEPSSLFGGTVYLNTPEGSGIEISAETELSLSVPASQPLPEQVGAPTPSVSSMAEAAGDPQTRAVHDVSQYGYVEAEYTISGTARPTVQDIALLEEEQPPIPDDVAEYATRMLVYRPEDPEQFNGDVVVEWMNVTQQRDAPVTAVNAYEYLLREGYAVVLVSVQKVGVDNSDQDRDLVTWDAERYGDLSHPGDSYAYDIFSQAMQAVGGNPSTDPLDGLEVENILATGMSQSGYYMQPYISSVHPDHQVADGFMPVATNIFDLGVPATSTPTMHLNTEDEAPSQAPDGEFYRLWEVAGASHVNVYLSAWFDVMDSRDFDQETQLIPGSEWDTEFAGQYGQRTGTIFGVCGTNYYPVRYAYRAALDHLQNWVRNGEAPPEADRIEFEGEENPEMVTDEYDNAVGGLRLPVIDEPVASYLARDEVCGADSDDPLASLQGATERLSDEQLNQLYADEDEYVSAIESAATEAVDSGFLLEADSESLLERAGTVDLPEQSDPGDDDGDDDGGTDDGTGDDGTGDDGTGDDGTTDDGGEDGGDSEDSDDSGPGFGIPAAAGGAGGAAYLLKRRFGSSDDSVETDADD